ncbi:MAG: methionine synthase [Elusimicrobia bacterium]|nr:methionine synthase [Elusimicrobiota bacterium]
MSDLKKLLAERILILDGAMGTQLQDMRLTAEDFGGHELEGCNENLVLTRPDAIAKVHAAYLEAGADIIETNSFGAVRHVLAEYGLQDRTVEIARAAARIAAAEAKRFSTPDKPRFTAGALGPGTKTISVTGGITFAEVRRNYAEASRGLIEGGSDLLLLETQQDTLNVKASVLGCRDAFDALGRSVPIVLSVSIETMGTMLGGQTAEALCASVEHFGLLALGLNCATGPDFMTDHLRTLSELARCAVVCYPNAGLPDEHGLYNESPEMVAAKMARFADHGWLNLAGGCCGTTPAHIRAIAAAMGARAPRVPASAPRAAVSGLEALALSEDRRPILVGERTNVIGSKKFRELVAAGELETAAEIGRRQARSGAHIIDVCLANPDRDEKSDMEAFLDILTKKVKAPLMIDTTDAAVLESALERCAGKCVINSVNLEDGEERFEAVVPLAKRYGAALVVGTIDEDKAAGMGVTRGRKLAIAARSYALLTEKYGVLPEDIVFDPLVFPCATGDKGYYGSAVETIEGVRLIKRAFPRAKTVLGVSNVSFGLPAAGREVLNSVFLHLCVDAGLDMAIVNAEKLARYATLPEEERVLAERVLLWKGPGDPDLPAGADPVAEFTAHFRHARPDAAEAAREARLKLPVGERLARMVVEGSKEGLAGDLDELLATMKPLAIINGPLMKGMDEVGRLFGDNKMIVAEVLQSAEVMKAAVAHLEPKMDHADAAARGSIMLATVKGDVHDIGKNLVHIILKNNGIAVHDLGIKVAPEALIEAARRLKPDLIGLSGLLVKSAQQMVATAEDLRAAGLESPILVGGAALSARFTANRIAPEYGAPVFYSKDAMTGLDLANQLLDPARKEALVAANRARQAELAAPAAAPAPAPDEAAAPAGPGLSYDHPVPSPPDLKRHVLEDFDLERILGYVNPVMLYGRHLGLKGDVSALLAKGDPKAAELRARVKALEDEVLDKKLIHPRAVVRFFAANGRGDELVLWDSARREAALETLRFPRQSGGQRLCLADFARPCEAGVDYAALFVVTCGAGVRELSTELRDKGEYLKSHALQALAIECAEGFAELLHERLRSMWGIPDAPGLTVKEKFQGRYRGIRVSPGYPACPDLEAQETFFRLLKPEEIGVELTDGFMMDPEASVSALVFHHPQARYFAVGPTSAEAALRGLAC